MSYVFAGRGRDTRRSKAAGGVRKGKAGPLASEGGPSASKSGEHAPSLDDSASESSASSPAPSGSENGEINIVDPQTREELGEEILDPHRVFALRQVLRETASPPTLIFCANSRRAAAVLRELSLSGWPAAQIAAGMRRSEKIGEIRRLRRGEAWALVCTDKALKGVEVPQVAVAISFDVPEKHARSGCRKRAAFVKKGGDAVVLFTDREVRELR